MKARLSVATSMGFTALDGLMMGRRCGAIDPGVLLHLIDERGMKMRELEHLLYQESGLLGVSGISNNMQVLQMSTAPEAREAIELFCYRAACGWLGIALDTAANNRHATRISTTASDVDVLVVPTDEETIIASATQGLIMEFSASLRA